MRDYKSYFGLNDEWNQELLDLLKKGVGEWEDSLKQHLTNNGVDPYQIDRDDPTLEEAGVIADWIIYRPA